MTNFDRQLDALESRAASLAVDLAGYENRLSRARLNTAKLLDLAARHDVTAVSVCKIHPRVGNEKFPFGESSSIYTPPEERIEDRPAAWYLAEVMGIGHGCGNTGQHQADVSELIDGVYEFRGGTWHRIDLEASE